MIDRLAGALSRSTALVGDDSAFTRAQLIIEEMDRVEGNYRALYNMLDHYYANNALYQRLQRALFDQGLPAESIRGLRNPSQLIVEFWAALLWPGDLPDALPIVTGDDVPNPDDLKAACETVWLWSNWASKKQLVGRRLSLYGDNWVKVAQPEGKPRVFLELIHPADVTEFSEDERGHLTRVRIDVRQNQRDQYGSVERRTHTEIWSKERQDYRRWLHSGETGVGERELGPPDQTRTFEQMGCSDFVPITRTPFRDLGGSRGVGAILLLKDSIDEVNRKATNLAETLFLDNTSSLFLESQSTPDKPTPPPNMDGRNETSSRNGGPVTVQRRQLWRVPAGWQLNYKIPPINFEAALAALQDDMRYLAKLAPELLWWESLDANGVESGIARRMRMAPAVARVNEVRGSAESDHARQLMMACTIGKNLNIPGFNGLGDFTDGAIDITFEKREVIPLTEKEDSELLVQKAAAYKSMVEAGISRVFAMQRCFDMEDDKEIEAALAMAEGELTTMRDAVRRDAVDGLEQ